MTVLKVRKYSQLTLQLTLHLTLHPKPHHTTLSLSLLSVTSLPRNPPHLTTPHSPAR
jgi:hypothetical protein